MTNERAACEQCVITSCLIMHEVSSFGGQMLGGEERVWSSSHLFQDDPLMSNSKEQTTKIAGIYNRKLQQASKAFFNPRGVRK